MFYEHGSANASLLRYDFLLTALVT